jgi:ubiquinone/menaquinone biosynthesis C-methylase UbiE
LREIDGISCQKSAIELAAVTDGENTLEVAVGTGLAFYEIVKRIRRDANFGKVFVNPSI